MLTRVMRRALGDGLMDLCVEPSSKTLSAGCRSGAVYLSDYAGAVFFESKLETAVSGVAHVIDADGAVLLAVACGDQARNAGEFALFVDADRVVSFQTRDPLWDVCISKSKRYVAASGWSGGLYIWDIQNGMTRREYSFPSSLHGLTALSGDRLLAVAEREGGLLIDFESGRIERSYDDMPGAAYKVSTSRDEQMFLVGGHGPAAYLKRRTGDTIAQFPSADCSATAIYAGLCFVGAQAGALSVYSEQHNQEPVLRVELGAGVKSLHIDYGEQLLFCALADGDLASFHINIEKDELAAAEEFWRACATGSAPTPREALGGGIPHAAMLNWFLDQYVQNTEHDDSGLALVEAYNLIEQQADMPAGEASALMLAALDVKLARHQRAIQSLQTIDPSSPYYVRSIVVLIEALLGAGQRAAARKIYAVNIEELKRAGVDVSGFGFDGALETSLSPPAPSGTVGTVSHDLIEQSGAALLERADSYDNTALFYGWLNYLKYEYANSADNVKKILEHARVQEILEAHSELSRKHEWRDDVTRRSLDIGCATCRYPLWFAGQGYHATGYDVDPSAIEICRRRSENVDRIEIYERNIFDCAPENEAYDVITCMMGTFNHFDMSLHDAFFRWCFQSLKPGGVLIFSSWNKDCPYTSFLQFYNRDDRRSLLANLRAPQSVEMRLSDAGFAPKFIHGSAYLPDDCYDAWANDVGDSFWPELDRKVASAVAPSESQMFVVGALKHD